MNNSGKTEIEKKMDAELLTACYWGPLSKVKELIEKGAEVNGLKWHGYEPVGHRGTTALCETSKVDIMEFLVEHGAKINEPDGAGNTPIVYAVRRLYIDNVRFLIEHGANVDVYEHEVNAETDLDGGYTGRRSFPTKCHLIYSAFHSDAYDRKKNCYEIIKMLLEKLDSTKLYFKNPLYMKEALCLLDIRNLDIRLIDLIINQGADVNSCGDGDRSPLWIAINSELKDVIKVLLKNHAIVKKEDLKLAKKTNKELYQFIKQTMKEMKLPKPFMWW